MNDIKTILECIELTEERLSDTMTILNVVIKALSLDKETDKCYKDALEIICSNIDSETSELADIRVYLKRIEKKDSVAV